MGGVGRASEGRGGRVAGGGGRGEWKVGSERWGGEELGGGGGGEGPRGGVGGRDRPVGDIIWTKGFADSLLEINIYNRFRSSVKIRPRKACTYPDLRSFRWVSYDKVGVLYSGKLGSRSEARASDLRSCPGALVETNKTTSLRRKRK